METEREGGREGEVGERVSLHTGIDLVLFVIFWSRLSARFRVLSFDRFSKAPSSMLVILLLASMRISKLSS